MTSLWLKNYILQKHAHYRPLFVSVCKINNTPIQNEWSLKCWTKYKGKHGGLKYISDCERGHGPYAFKCFQIGSFEYIF